MSLPNHKGRQDVEVPVEDPQRRLRKALRNTLSVLVRSRRVVAVVGAGLLDAGNHAEAEVAFSKLATDAPSGYRTLAMLRAAEEAAQRDRDAAVKMFDAIGANPDVALPEQDLARIRAALLVLDTASVDDMRKRLEPISGADRPFRHTARDLLALASWRANDAAEARRWIDAIMNDPETPRTIRIRADELYALLPPVAKS